MATPRGRFHGINDEHQRRGAASGSPFSFTDQEWRQRGIVLGRARPYRIARFISYRMRSYIFLLDNRDLEQFRG